MRDVSRYNEIGVGIEEVIEAGLVPKLVSFLDSIDENIQYTAAWAITNIASGNARQTERFLFLSFV